MTPERLAECKKYLRESGNEFVRDLLTALREAQRDISDLKRGHDAILQASNECARANKAVERDTLQRRMAALEKAVECYLASDRGDLAERQLYAALRGGGTR